MITYFTNIASYDIFLLVISYFGIESAKNVTCVTDLRTHYFWKRESSMKTFCSIMLPTNS